MDQPGPSQLADRNPTSPDPATDPDPWSQTGPSPSPNPYGDPGAATGASESPASSTPASTDTSSGSGAGGASLERMTRAGLTEAAGHAFAGVGGALNTICKEDRAATEEPDRIWIPTDDERKGFEKPVGRILARRVPDVPGGQADDAGDLIAAAIPLGIWAIRGLADLVPRHVGKHRRRGRQPSPDQAEQQPQS